MASTAANTTETMQYKSAEQMQASPSAFTQDKVRPVEASLQSRPRLTSRRQQDHTSDCESQTPKKERTILGMRGGGIICK